LGERLGDFLALGAFGQRLPGKLDELTIQRILPC
jgi:hypothetical protein